jgi:undecaprenyl-diphosphatase
MSWLQVVVLAIVQGLGEFLPISSSGHLVLVPNFFGWSDQGLVFDVAVHFGTLGAVCLYFREDVQGLFKGAVQLVGGNRDSLQARMALSMAVATVPAAIAGLLFAGWIAENLRSPVVVAITLSAYGILLALADRYGRQIRNISQVGLRDALIIGLAQALALVPGTSRSGITITAGMLLGLRRQDAARFSFLLSVPVILLATGYELLTILTTDIVIDWGQLAVAALIASIVAYISIEFFMRFVNAIGLLPFAIYRLILAGVILYVLV